MKSMVRFVAGLALAAVIAIGSVALLSTPSQAGRGGGQRCGGIQGLLCPSPKQKCVDDPRDNCDPKTGGADCIGICRGPGGSQ